MPGLAGVITPREEKDHLRKAAELPAPGKKKEEEQQKDARTVLRKIRS